jgi:hypothetical protein
LRTAISLWLFLMALKIKEIFQLWKRISGKSSKPIQLSYWKLKEFIGKTEQK